MFKKLFFVTLCLILNVAALAQGKYTGDSNELNRRLKLKKLPTMRVWDKYGNEHELNKYIRNNELNAGKPLLLVGFGVGGSYSLNELNELAKSSIPDQYNVLVLCVGDSVAMREKKVTKNGYEKEWSKFMVTKILWKDLALFYKESWPFSLFTDKDGKILYFQDGWVLPVQQIQNIFSLIDAKKITQEKYWYTKNGELTGNDAADAYYFHELKTDGKRITEISGTKTTVNREVNYVLRDNVYYYDTIDSKYDVKVYQTKADIMTFLQTEFEKKVDKTNYNKASVYLSDSKLSIYNLLSKGEIDYKNIISVKLKRLDGILCISVFGKFNIENERDGAITRSDILLNNSLVDDKLAFQIKENLQQLAILNKSKLMMEQIVKKNESELFFELNNLLAGGRNLNIERARISCRGKINTISITKDRYEINFYDYNKNKINAVNITGFDWTKISKITYEKISNHNCVTVFFKNNLIERSSEYGEKKETTVDFNVSESDAEKVIAILHQIQELNTK